MINRIKTFFKKSPQQTNKEFDLDLVNILGGIDYADSGLLNLNHSQFFTVVQKQYNLSSSYQEAVQKIVQASQSLHLCLFDKEDKECDVIPDDIKLFLQNPEKGENWNSFLRRAFIQYFISGEIIFLKDHKNKQLYLVYPSELLEINNLDGEPYRYKISRSFFERNKITEEKVEDKIYEKNRVQNGNVYCDVVHMFNANPISNRGLSFLLPLMEDVEILIKGRKWNHSILRNDGRPSIVFFYPPKTRGALAQTQESVGAQITKQNLIREVSGYNNAGKPILLKGGLDFKHISYSMKDLDFLNGLKLSRNNIGNMLGIPLPLFGSEDAATYNNIKELKEVFFTDTIVPLMNQFLNFLSYQVLYDFFPFLKTYKIKVDKKKIDALLNKQITKMERLDKITFLTVNEKRTMCELDELKFPTADIPLMPSGVIPLDELGLDDDVDIDDDEDDEEIEENPEEEEEEKEEEKEEKENDKS